MKTEKISSLALYVCFAVIIVLFVAFFTVGYDNQYELNPKFNDPMLLDAVMYLMYAMVIITAALIVWSVAKSFTQNMGGPKGENLSGVPGGKISAFTIAVLVISLVVGFVIPAGDPIVANGEVVTNTADLMMADCAIWSIYILTLVAVVAMFVNLSGILKK